MTRAKISEYSATANDNTDVNGINIAEGCPPSSMNNMGREIMAALKRFQVGSDGDGVTVGGSLVVSGSTSVNTFNVDVISEKTSAAGVTVDGVLLKDSQVSTDQINEKTSAAGVTIDGVLLKDSGVNGLTVGQGAGSVSTNTAVGASALAANTTGANNTAVGYQALLVNTTGDRNTALGASALDANTTGARNTAVGISSLGANTTGANNTAVGDQAMGLNTTGSNNIAFGLNALYSNTTGTNNVAMGLEALYSNTTGAKNTAVGFQALDSNTTGAGNTGLGYRAAQAVTTGASNVVIGEDAGFNLTTGTQNILVGYGAGADGMINVTTENYRAVFGNNQTTNAYVKVAWTVTSDARDKTSVEPVPHGLSFVQQLNPVSYRWKTSREDDTPHGNRRYGFLAQDILALEGGNPVIIDNETPEHLKYQGEALVPVLVNAIKELSAQVTALQAEVNTLKGN